MGGSNQVEKRSKSLLEAQRTSALRITSAYRTVSGAAVLVIAGVVPIDLIIKERHKLWTKKPNNTLEQGETETIRHETLQA